MIEQKLNSAYLLSYLEVICDLRKIPVLTSGNPRQQKSEPFAIYQLQVSNDKTVFSKKSVSYVVYDSKCIVCDLKNFNCTLKVSKLCDIEAKYKFLACDFSPQFL